MWTVKIFVNKVLYCVNLLANYQRNLNKRVLCNLKQFLINHQIY